MLSWPGYDIDSFADIGVNATFQTLSTAACTSCETSADKSAYWSPTLYYKYPNGSFLEVPHGGGVVYYLGRGPNVNKTVPFPPGMMILTGDKSARSYDNTTMTYGTAQYPGRPIADRVSFACLTATDGVQQTVGINNTDCLNGLRAQVHYQSCWNGNDLYKADNSHVAYQSAIDDGICPPTHPVQLPHVFLEVLYNVNDVPNKTADGLFVFSQGDPTGYGFHADFQNGWDMKVQTNITIDCLATDNFGQISACPALQATQSDGYANNCPERPPQIGEATNGLISQLPGCITITYGPGAAPAASMSCPSTVPKPSITKTQDTVVPPTKLVAPGRLFGGLGHQYLGCYNDSAGGVRALNAYAYTNTTGMTVEMCQSICTSKGYGLHGVEYAQECHCDNKLNNNAVRGPLGCNWNCAGTMSQGLAATQEICGGYGYISVYNQTNFTVPAPVAKVGGYAYQGCLTDPNNGGGRSLLGPATTSAQMTNEMCVQFCQGKGQRYAG